MSPLLEEHYFRHEYGRLVALLTRRVGIRHLDVVEDAVQAALLAALDGWTRGGAPENPSAWLYRAALNHVLGELRGRARRDRLHQRHQQLGAADVDGDDVPDPRFPGEVRDDLLRMLFACCDDTLPVESQLVLALKTLSGFSVGEIAERLFTTETNIYKRLARARAQLRDLRFEPRDLTAVQLAERLPAVRSILYTMFTEAYLSSNAEHAIRRELCNEAKRLTGVLAAHPATATPETFALLALMHLHVARMPAREDASGGLLLLEEQDRSRFDTREIENGLTWLARSAHGDLLSRYHVEASIAAEHCVAASFAETRWDRIAGSYAILERIAPSAIFTLNRAVAVAEWKGANAGLAIIDGLQPPSWLAGSHLFAAVLSDLHRRCDHHEIADEYRTAALEAAPSLAIKELLARRLRARDR